MPVDAGDNYSRGAQLLELWRGKRRQIDVLDLLDVDAASYNRFEHGKRRPPAEVGFHIEAATRGDVPAKSWYEPADDRLSRRLLKLRDERAAA